MDYVAVSTSLIKSIDEFKVHPLTCLSDHRPITACIDTYWNTKPKSCDSDSDREAEASGDVSDCPKSFKWVRPESFVRAQSDNTIQCIQTRFEHQG